MEKADPRTDAELLAATGGDVEAFGVFYRRHVRSMLGALMRRTGDAELAADLTSEVFAAALLASRRYEPQLGTPTAWLFGIASHKLANAAKRGSAERRARRRLRMEPVVVEAADVEWIEALTAAGAGQDVMGLLGELPVGQRELVTARVIEERSYEDLARERRVSEAVVRKRVSRGLATLRTRLVREEDRS